MNELTLGVSLLSVVVYSLAPYGRHLHFGYTGIGVAVGVELVRVVAPDLR